MGKIIEVPHKGVTVKIRELTTLKNKTRYTEYQIVDYSTGKRVRHSRATLEEAKTKAKEIAEVLVSGRREVLEWDERQRASIRQALEALKPTPTRLDRAAAIFADAVKLVEADEILAACRHWRDHGPGKRFTPRNTKEAVAEFLERQRHRISPRRYRTNRSYLGSFTKKFCDRLLHEIEATEIKDWASGNSWCVKTKNDALGVVSLLYRDAIERKFAQVNPANFKRDKLRSADVEIYTPQKAKTMLATIEDELKPFLATMLFSGLRKEEASRLTGADVDAALQSGVFFLNGGKTKTGRSRSVTVTENLRAWLEAYHRPGTALLPVRWQAMAALDDLHKHIVRKSKVPWVRNGCRHSYGTFHVRQFNDLALTVSEMGNSLTQLSRHYVSRAKAVTKEMAQEYFAIKPSGSAEVIKLKAA